MASRVHEDNFTVILSYKHGTCSMWKAIDTAHQNNTASGRYMHLRAMFTTRGQCDEEIPKLITTKDTLRQRLWNARPDGQLSINDIYFIAAISALPKSWTTVTAPLKLKANVTGAKLKSVLRVILSNLEINNLT